MMKDIDMYESIIEKIKELGEVLRAAAGDVKNDIRAKDAELEEELSRLIATFPGRHAIFAEELHKEYIGSENVWIIDPISNTNNFRRGIPYYSIVVSHMHKGEIIFAAVYDPSMKELFTAEKGKGAFLNGRRIRVSTSPKKIFSLVGPHVGPRSNTGETLKIIEALSREGTVRILGSLGIHYAYVACGRADAAVSFNFDTFPEFAGKLLVEEAGGKFTDFKGNPLSVETKDIIATNGIAHDRVQKAVFGII